LNLLEEVEGEMAALYDWLARTFATADAQVTAFFAKMARDELHHRDLVRFQNQLVSKSRHSFPPVPIDVNGIAAHVKRVRKLRDNYPPASVGLALALALELEESPVESHYRHAIAQASPGLARLIASLNKADEHHADHLRQFMQQRGLTVG